MTELPLLANSQDFIFDNQMLVQAHAFGMRIGEISCPTKYFEDASEIDFRRSVVYGLGVLRREPAIPAVAHRRRDAAHLFRRAPNGACPSQAADRPRPDDGRLRLAQPAGMRLSTRQ